MLSGRLFQRKSSAAPPATAHPAKFSASVTQAVGKPAELPLHLSDLLSRKERYTVLPNALAEVKAFVLERARHK